MPTQQDLAREAVAQIGSRASFVLNDNSPIANYVALLYGPIRDFLLAEGDYDFSLVGAVLAAATPASLAPWTLSYAYPSDALRIRQLVPTVFDINDPRPVTWNVNSVSGSRRIYTTVSMSTVIYTKAVAESLWDPLFSESFVRMLSSALAFAIENRIEASKQKLEEALSFAGVANMRDQ